MVFPFRYAQRGAALLCTALAVAVSGCASTPPPTDQMAVADSAVNDAMSAGGPEYAPVPMRDARAKLDSANAAMGAKDYPRARRLAEEAEVDAKLATATARSAQAQKAVAELQTSVRALRAEIDRRAP